MVEITLNISASWNYDLEILPNKLYGLPDSEKTIAFAASGTTLFGNRYQTAPGCQIAQSQFIG
jgi:hypothetical protein